MLVSALRFVLFTDAGYGSLREGKSTRSSLVTLATAGKRGEFADCAGWAILTSSGKVDRIARSSLAAEVIALSPGVDILQWIRTYFHEIMTGEFSTQLLLAEDLFPLQTPFLKHLEEVEHSEKEEQKIGVMSWCYFFAIVRRVCLWRRCSFNTIVFAVTNVINDGSISAIALTGCPNAYATISAVSVNSNDRSMRILLAYIRDNTATVCLSFLDAVFNLADVATKRYGNAGIYRKFVETGKFTISFLGRKLSDALANSRVSPQ